MKYSEKVMDHFMNPRNVGEIENADGVGVVGNAKCGDIMKMYLKIENDVITVQVCAAMAGWVNSAMVMNADWTYAKDWPTDVITMVIIGGTSMSGGSGRVWGTLVGVVLISVLINGMTILNWNIYIQYIVRGAILILSLLVMTYRDKLRD